ncbi:hypothetical protein [Deinococcus sonorensis]|uniref:Nucleotidyltransferase n=2 Tax=Deinococcus sonorensis TaxID=309891 RepID=A0AAU7UFL7_9DEIO
MPTPARLLERLSAIAASLARTGKAQALIGLGSVGLELERLDAHSDLDFFVIAEDGQKGALLADLSWMTEAASDAYFFQNTPDGYKWLFSDGVFCEFAVFEPPELAGIPFAPGRVVWKKPGVPETIALPLATSHHPETTLEWVTGEALTNLLVGLQRYRRGERLSALRFVQGYALDRVLQLMARQEGGGAGQPDPFAPERRLEQRHPEAAALLMAFAPGYLGTPDAALAMLAWLEAHVTVNPAIAAAIRQVHAGIMADRA